MKRAAEPTNDDSDDDFGPMPATNTVAEVDNEEKVAVKKAKRTLPFEKTYIDSLPSANMYERSFMHRDLVTHISVAKSAEFVVTGSCDGHVKFWKKMPDNIEFVKHFQAHLGAIHCLLVSPDDLKVVTTSVDKMIKFFEILSFDMSHMISTEYVPTAAVWLSSERGLFSRVAVADQDSGCIRVYRADGGQQGILAEIGVHTQPVKCMALNLAANTIISADAKGVIEYWDADTFLLPKNSKISFEFKTETDLYSLAKARTIPCTISTSRNGELFVVTSRDKQIRVFDFKKGKMKKVYDESVEVYQGASAASVLGGSEGLLDTLVLGRKQAMERELEASPETLGRCNAIFDESGHFLIYGALTGIKILNLVTNRVVKVLGTGESGERFLTVALYQGTPKVDTQFMLAKAGAEAVVKTAEQLQKKPEPDATVFTTSFKKRRFYCFSRRGPDESKEGRDVLNEMPTEQERSSVVEVVPKGLGREAILRTSLGDVHIKLFPSECPRTVENFSTLARNGYYDNVIFHRVIKGFMIQTGDPLGDGTGGESIWGGEFEDEFDRNLRHDRPFTVSMANSGPGTNGSQFFITTVPTPWLDQKHTVFGRVTSGFDVISKIELSRVNKYDKPDTDIKILGVEVSM